MRYLLLAGLLACSSTSPVPRTMGATPEAVTTADACSVACQHRHDWCHMLPTVEQCATACRQANDPVAKCWAAASNAKAVLACDPSVRCQ